MRCARTGPTTYKGRRILTAQVIASEWAELWPVLQKRGWTSETDESGGARWVPPAPKTPAAAAASPPASSPASSPASEAADPSPAAASPFSPSPTTAAPAMSPPAAADGLAVTVPGDEPAVKKEEAAVAAPAAAEGAAQAGDAAQAGGAAAAASAQLPELPKVFASEDDVRKYLVEEAENERRVRPSLFLSAARKAGLKRSFRVCLQLARQRQRHTSASPVSRRHRQRTGWGQSPTLSTCSSLSMVRSPFTRASRHNTATVC